MSTDFEQVLSRLRTRQFFAVAGQTILIQDYILTLPLEIEYIWPAKWQIAKVIFLLNRYGSLIGQSVFTLEELGLLSHRSVEFCQSFQWFIAFYALLSEESIHILVLLRAWAIWGCKYYAAVALISAYSLYLATSIGLLAFTISITTNKFLQVRPLYLEETAVCIRARVADSSQLALPLISLSLDALVFVMVASALAKIFKQTQGFKLSPVSRVLVIDAALYFVTNAVTGTIALLCQTLFLQDPRGGIVIASIPLLTITGQRVVLNLRRLKAPTWQSDLVVRPNVDEQTARNRPSPAWPEHWSTGQHRDQQSNHAGGWMDNGSDIELVVMKQP